MASIVCAVVANGNAVVAVDPATFGMIISDVPVFGSNWRSKNDQQESKIAAGM